MIELEELGYSTIWLTGGQLDNLGQITDVLRVTRQVRVASRDHLRRPVRPEAVAACYTEMEVAHPGRFVVGLGGAHGPRPLQTLAAYLDRLDVVPATARVMVALEPRMLDLARDRAAGALSVLVTPEYTARPACGWAQTPPSPSSSSGTRDRPGASARNRARTTRLPEPIPCLPGEPPPDGLR